MSDALHSPPPAVQFDEAGVRYRVPQDRTSSFKEYAIRRFRGGLRYIEHEALRDITLSVAPGDTLGIIGQNGAGKTTLLRLIARVLVPTSGRVRVRGRVAPILDIVGAFHPELTGRENVFLNGTMLGLSRREIASRMANIAAFAEIDTFMDAPLRTFSAGMIARLGFAVASEVDPDILVIDETLAVGDARFQVKCAERLDRFRAKGVTLLLASHDMSSIRRLCRRSLWLERGRARMLDATEAVVSAYLAAQKDG